MGIFALCCLCLFLTRAHSAFNIVNNTIYDRAGATRIFHGINLVTKVPPYYDLNFGVPDLQLMNQWGLNAIRLGVMWPGVQPTQDHFN